jgi:hypothetical protein
VIVVAYVLINRLLASHVHLLNYWEVARCSIRRKQIRTVLGESFIAFANGIKKVKLRSNYLIAIPLLSRVEAICTKRK